VVHVDQPRDGVQQCAPLHVRQGSVSGVGQQQIQVVSCRVRQLPFVSVELCWPESTRRGELAVVFGDVTSSLKTQSRWGRRIETLVALLNLNEECLGPATASDVVSSHGGQQA